MRELKESFYNFIINGSAGVGKDTFVEIFSDCLVNYKNIIVNNISTVSYIKGIARDSFGWNDVKDEKGRRLLSDLLDADIKYQNGPFKRVTSYIDKFKMMNIPTYKIINFIHCREPLEIDKYKNALENSKTILIRRSLNKSYLNHADQNVEKYIYDFMINNNGTIKDYKKLIYSFIDTHIFK